MSTLDAQCLLADLIASEPKGGLPSHWAHSSDGELTWRFAGSDNTFTWSAEDVEEMTGRWLEVGACAPEAVAATIAAHERLLESCRLVGGRAPDVVHHDLEAAEVVALWTDEKLAVIVECVGEATASASSRS